MFNIDINHNKTDNFPIIINNKDFEYSWSVVSQ